MSKYQNALTWALNALYSTLLTIAIWVAAGTVMITGIYHVARVIG